MRTWNGCGAVAMSFSTTNNLHDRPRLEIAHPARAAAVEPRAGPIVDDPEARLKPPAIRLLRPKNNDLSPGLDEGPVSERADHPGIARAAQQEVPWATSQCCVSSSWTRGRWRKPRQRRSAFAVPCARRAR